MIPFLIPSLIAGGSSLLSGLFQGGAQRRAAREQARAAQQALAAQQQALSPYMEAGRGALSQMQTLMGMGSPEEQAAAIGAIEQGPEMASMIAQGENAMLQNAAATGGLRGGNLQGALAQFRPQVLNQLINQRMSQLGGIAGMGQSSAAALGQAGANAATAAGNAAAAQTMAGANMWNALPNALMSGLGMYTGLGGTFGGGGGAPAPAANPQVNYPAGGRNAAGW